MANTKVVMKEVFTWQRTEPSAELADGLPVSLTVYDVGSRQYQLEVNDESEECETLVFEDSEEKPRYQGTAQEISDRLAEWYHVSISADFDEAVGRC